MTERLRQSLEQLRDVDVFWHSRFQNRAQACQCLLDEDVLVKEVDARIRQIRRVKKALQYRAPEKPKRAIKNHAPADESEKGIEEAIRAYLRALGAFEIKVWTGGIALFDGRVARNNNKGAADILACWRGRFVAIEVKSKTGRVSPEQVAFLADVKRAGGIALVARSLDDVRRALEAQEKTK